MQTISKNNCDFPSLRQSGCLYVDKTAWFAKMAMDPESLRGVSKTDLDVSDLNRFPVAGMLYQTGYLTIKDYKDGIFELGILPVK